LRPLPDHVTCEPVGEFRTNVAAVAGSCTGTGPLPSPDHLHELDSVGIALTVSGRKRRLWHHSLTTSTAAQPSSKHKMTGLASALVMFQSYFGATPNPPWRDSSSPPISPSRHNGPAVKCHPLCRTTVMMSPPRSCPFIRTACSSLPLGHMLPPRSHGLRLLSSTGQENPRC